MIARVDPDAPLFLVGFMGVGKSTVGQALAVRWGWAFVDTDALVEKASGRSVEEIFRDVGEGRFREAEWSALRALEGRKRLVVATGGGLFLGVAQRGFIREHGLSCWLDAPLDVVMQRVGSASSRPLWPMEDAVSRRVFFERRRAVYALADIRVDASRGDATFTAGEVDRAKHSFWR